MQIFRLVLREFVGMFIDDEFLALAILAVVAAAAILAFGLQAPIIWAASSLVGGCVAVLAVSVIRAGRAP